jgi:RNA polymerase sigma factor (TIGR02999 family)
MPADPRITGFLQAHAAGDPAAFDRMVEDVYDHLRHLARRQLGRGRRGTLDTSGLVHEAYLRFTAQGAKWNDRGHFFASASRAMRHVLVDAARRRARGKRGGDVERVEFDPERLAAPERCDDLLALDAALIRLAERNARLAQVVECRAFAGLSEAETAEALGVSLRTVQRDFRAARVWLATALGQQPAGR